MAWSFLSSPIILFAFLVIPEQFDIADIRLERVRVTYTKNRDGTEASQFSFVS